MRACGPAKTPWQEDRSGFQRLSELTCGYGGSGFGVRNSVKHRGGLRRLHTLSNTAFTALRDSQGKEIYLNSNRVECVGEARSPVMMISIGMWQTIEAGSDMKHRAETMVVTLGPLVARPLG